MVKLKQEIKDLGIMFKIFGIALLIIFSTLAIVEVFAAHNPGHNGGGGGPGGPPKVDIFAKKMGNAILVTWENPDDTADDIKFRYTVSRDVNRTENFEVIFNSQRDIEEKIIDERNGQEMFFYLDEDIQPGNDYTYQVGAGNPQGNPNPRLSDDTRPLFIDPQVKTVRSESNGHLIVGRTLTPIQPIISWFNWFEPQLANAEDTVNIIFTTSLNPQNESYRLALEPMPKPNSTGNCDQILEFGYITNADKGQNFEVMASIFQTEIHTDDDTGVEVSQEVKVLKHQQLFNNFSDTSHLKQKWLTIPPVHQKIINFTELEVQFDISAEFEINPLNHRSLTFNEVVFLVPLGINAC